jgi:hypothetical protein
MVLNMQAPAFLIPKQGIQITWCGILFACYSRHSTRVHKHAHCRSYLLLAGNCGSLYDTVLLRTWSGSSRAM